MATNTWDNGSPLGTAAANTLETIIQTFKLDVYERERQGDRRWTNGAPDGGNDGKTCVGILDGLGDAGVANLCWNAAGTTSRVKQYGSGHANVDRTEFPGEVYAGPSGDKKLAGIASAATVRLSFYDAMPQVAYVKAVVYKVPAGSPARTLKRIRLVAGTRPTAASLDVDIRKAAAPGLGVDRFLDASTTSVGTASLTNASANYSVEATVSQALAADDEIIVKWTAVNGAQDVTVLLQIE